MVVMMVVLMAPPPWIPDRLWLGVLFVLVFFLTVDSRIANSWVANSRIADSGIVDGWIVNGWLALDDLRLVVFVYVRRYLAKVVGDIGARSGFAS
jgi:hypothetical protein